MIDQAPIVFDETADAMIERARLARAYRPFFAEAARDFAGRFSPAGRRHAAQIFIERICRAIPDATTRATIEATAQIEFERMEIRQWAQRHQ